MRYFIKVSWQDKEQPLKRIHENAIVTIDEELFDKGLYNLVRNFREQTNNEYNEDFIVDFMMPLPESTQ